MQQASLGSGKAAGSAVAAVAGKHPAHVGPWLGRVDPWGRPHLAQPPNKVQADPLPSHADVVLLLNGREEKKLQNILPV